MTGKLVKILPVLLFAVMISGAALHIRAASIIPQEETGGEDQAEHGGYSELPDWIGWKEREIRSVFSWEDPSRPAGPDEPCLVRLSDRRVIVESSERILFETPDSLYVQDVLVTDADRDGQRELALLCWRRGHYDRAHPFWIRRPVRLFRQQIFIYDWKDGEFSPRWMASDILIDVYDWQADTMNIFHLTEPDGKTSRWCWNHWGLERLDESLNSNRLTFAAVGDDLIHIELIGEAKQQGGYDFMYDGIRDRIRYADLAMINQETPFVTELSRVSGYPQFGTPYTVGNALRDAGFDVASCATNHALDQGLHGVQATSSFFEENDILHPGMQTVDEKAYVPYQILQKHGIRIAFLGYTEITNGYPEPVGYPYAVHLFNDEARVRSDLQAAREEADLVIVFAHWGTEYTFEPDSFQKYWCDVFLSEGVDVVIGTHPHVLQPFGLRKRADGHEMLVYYSLGNFISAQCDPARDLGGLAEFTVVKDTNGVRFESYALEPLVTHIEPGNWTTYLLSDYSDELASRHALKGMSVSYFRELFARATASGGLFQ